MRAKEVKERNGLHGTKTNVAENANTRLREALITIPLQIQYLNGLVLTL